MIIFQWVSWYFKERISVFISFCCHTPLCFLHVIRIRFEYTGINSQNSKSGIVYISIFIHLNQCTVYQYVLRFNNTFIWYI